MLRLLTVNMTICVSCACWHISLSLRGKLCLALPNKADFSVPHHSYYVSLYTPMVISSGSVSLQIVYFHFPNCCLSLSSPTPFKNILMDQIKSSSSLIFPCLYSFFLETNIIWNAGESFYMKFN